VKGQGNQQDYGMRIYDPRLGRFLSVDPLTADYPWNSAYSYAEGNPINFIDVDGLEIPAYTAQSAPQTVQPALRVVVNNLVKEGVKRQAKVIAYRGAAQGLGLTRAATGLSANPFTLTVLGIFIPNSAHAPSPSLRFQPLNNPFALPNIDPKQKPGEDEDGNKQTYIYETGGSQKAILSGSIADLKVLPYFGITNSPVIAGGAAGTPRYGTGHERAEYLPAFGAILGKTDRFTAEGVELALIGLNTYGKDFDLKVAAGTLRLSSNDVRSSSRIDNLRFSFSDEARLRAGLNWLQNHYGRDWQDIFLHPENPGATRNGTPPAVQDNTTLPQINKPGVP
jgi:hypothetical protein